MDKINKKLIKIMENVFNKKISKIDNLKINSFEEWDSVNHFYILLEIEKVFSIKFSEKEFFELNTIKLIKKKISQKLK